MEGFWANVRSVVKNTRGEKRNKCSELSGGKVIEESRNSPLENYQKLLKSFLEIERPVMEGVVREVTLSCDVKRRRP